ncbi:MAG: hypothetical protein ACP5NG_00810, partial [Conexivisphaera sp.]
MPRATSSLRGQLLDLLDKDREFRYAVAGKLGLSEILERLDRNEEAIRKLWESNERLWQEVKSLRENQEKLWRTNERWAESNERLWQEVKALREG